MRFLLTEMSEDYEDNRNDYRINNLNIIFETSIQSFKYIQLQDVQEGTQIG